MASVLIVDDNLLMRHLLREILSDGGHTALGEAKNGLEAPALVRDLHPDVITLDLVMPGRPGLPTLKHLMMVDKSLPVVVCSSFLNENHVIEALTLGAKGFIVKPFDRSAVLSAVSGALREAQLDKRQQNAQLPPIAELDLGSVGEQREFTRVEASLRVVLEPRDGVLNTSTVNLSGSGMLIDSGLLDADASVAFRLYLEDGSPVTGTARVVRIDACGRAALAFEYLTVLDHERVVSYIRAQQVTPALAYAL